MERYQVLESVTRPGWYVVYDCLPFEAREPECGPFDSAARAEQEAAKLNAAPRVAVNNPSTGERKQ